MGMMLEALGDKDYDTRSTANTEPTLHGLRAGEGNSNVAYPSPSCGLGGRLPHV